MKIQLADYNFDLVLTEDILNSNELEFQMVIQNDFYPDKDKQNPVYIIQEDFIALIKYRNILDIDIRSIKIQDENEEYEKFIQNSIEDEEFNSLIEFLQQPESPIIRSIIFSLKNKYSSDIRGLAIEVNKLGITHYNSSINPMKVLNTRPIHLLLGYCISALSRDADIYE